MSDFNDFSLFDYDDSLNIFDNYSNDNNKNNQLEFINNNDEMRIDNNFDLNSEIKPKIFKVNNYEFLKKKREESNEKTKKKRSWTENEDTSLKRIVIDHPHLSWTEISKYFPYRSNIQCMHRWQKVLQPGLKKGKWSDEEDKILINWVNKNGAGKWCQLTLFLKGRSSKQIRDRWINNLNPDRKKDFVWSLELDEILLKNYLQFGSSWVQISKFIPNSSENMIKNRFYCMLRSVACKKKNKCQNIVKKKSVSNQDEFINFAFDNSNSFDDNSFGDFSSEKNKKVKKRENYNLSYLVNFLPFLLEEKGIDVNNITNKNYVNINPSVSNSSQIILNDDHRRILNNFFCTLSERFPNKQNDIKFQSNSEKTNAQFKFKSTILLNLQLHLLQRIFERCKLQIIGRFFQLFKGCSNVTGIDTRNINSNNGYTNN